MCWCYYTSRKLCKTKPSVLVLLYIKETIPAYEVQLQEEADCKEAIWCKLVTGHTTVTIGVVYRCPNITKQNNEKIHNAISEVSKGDCIIMGDFNHGNIKWDTLPTEHRCRRPTVFVPDTGQFVSTAVRINPKSGFEFRARSVQSFVAHLFPK